MLIAHSACRGHAGQSCRPLHCKHNIDTRLRTVPALLARVSTLIPGARTAASSDGLLTPKGSPADMSTRVRTQPEMEDRRLRPCTNLGSRAGRPDGVICRQQDVGC